MKTHYTIPFFIPHKGCPFTCIFCNQNRISGEETSASPESIPQTISRYLETIPRTSHIEVGFFGGSFTGLPVNLQQAYLRQAQDFIKQDKIDGIRLSTRPDFIDQNILRTLKEYNVSCIELGVQSMSDIVLEASQRGHTFKDIKKASNLILQNNFVLGHQIMIGLPKSTLARELETAKISIGMGAAEVRIYPVVVIKGTELADMFKQGLYTPLTEEEAVLRCAKVITLFEKNGVNVIRCGLHPSEGLVSRKDILGGPFHEAFRQKVETAIYGNLFRKLLKNNKTAGVIDKIYYNPEETAYVIGYERQNAGYVESLLGRRDIFKPDASLGTGKIRIDYNGKRPKILNKISS